MKIYKSSTNLSVNVVLKSGASMHVVFSPRSNNGSVFVTDNEEVQFALEHHYKYGQLFYGEEVAPETPAEEKKAEETGEESKVMKVEVKDLSSAKDYLAEKHGLSRTTLKSRKAIMDAAASLNIEFTGI